MPSKIILRLFHPHLYNVPLFVTDALKRPGEKIKIGVDAYAQKGKQRTNG